MLNALHCLLLIIGLNFVTSCAASSDPTQTGYTQTELVDAEPVFTNWMEAAAYQYGSIDSFFATYTVESDPGLGWLDYLYRLGDDGDWQNSLFVQAVRCGRSDLLSTFSDWYSYPYVSILCSAMSVEDIDIELVKNLVGGLPDKIKLDYQKQLVNLAMRAESLAVLDVLIDRFPSLVNDFSQHDILTSLLKGKKYKLIVYLLNKGAKIDIGYESERVWIDFLMLDRSGELATMIENTADKNKWNGIFFHAIFDQRVPNEVLNIFVQKGVDVNAQVKGYRILSLAAWANRSFVNDLLALDHIDVNAINDGDSSGTYFDDLRGSTPLTSLVIRALRGRNELNDVSAFISHPRIKANINAVDRNGMTALGVVCNSRSDGAFRVLESLVKLGNPTITFEDFQNDYRRNWPLSFPRVCLLFLCLAGGDRDLARNFLRENQPDVELAQRLDRQLDAALDAALQAKNWSPIRSAWVSAVVRTPRHVPASVPASVPVSVPATAGPGAPFIDQVD